MSTIVPRAARKLLMLVVLPSMLFVVLPKEPHSSAPAVDQGSSSTALPDLATDTDGDGLSDEQEIALGSDPSDPDSDHDGVRDGIDPDSAAGIVAGLPRGAFKDNGNGLRTQGNRINLLADTAG
jgi:hypothetical protein